MRVCVQAYLHRSAADIDRLNAAGVPVRLVKGAYREPPSVAFPRKQDVDEELHQADEDAAGRRRVSGDRDSR